MKLDKKLTSELNIVELRRGIKEVKEIKQFTLNQIKEIKSVIKALHNNKLWSKKSNEAHIKELDELLVCKKLYVNLTENIIKNAEEDLKERESNFNG